MARARHNEAEMQGIATRLGEFEQRYPLPGVRSKIDRDVLIKQLIDSIRRVEFVGTIRSRPISERRLDPGDEIFDPVRAAIRQRETMALRRSLLAGVLIRSFLASICIRSGATFAMYTGNSASAQIGLGQRFRPTRRHSVTGCRANEARIGRGSRRGFGGHRRYVSLDADSGSGLVPPSQATSNGLLDLAGTWR